MVSTLDAQGCSRRAASDGLRGNACAVKVATLYSQDQRKYLSTRSWKQRYTDVGQGKYSVLMSNRHGVPENPRMKPSFH